MRTHTFITPRATQFIPRCSIEPIATLIHAAGFVTRSRYRTYPKNYRHRAITMSLNRCEPFPTRD